MDIHPHFTMVIINHTIPWANMMAHLYHMPKNHLLFQNENNTYNITRFLTMDIHPTLPWVLLIIPYHGSSIPCTQKLSLISQSKYFINFFFLVFNSILLHFGAETLSLA